MTTAYISLGSNLDNPKKNIRAALRLIDSVEGVTIKGVAPLYLTEPVGYEEQEWFHNTLAQVETTLEPLELLKNLQLIEIELGRVRIIRWGPRTIDLDIVLYGDLSIDHPELQIPHPRFMERAFVLAPLMDLQPDMILPSGLSVGEALQNLTEKKYICTDEKMW